jgi:DNA-binding NarL/FixJ family response regulator
VDDHPFLRAGIVGAINSQGDMVLIGEASNGKEAVENFRLLRPDVTLMDLQMPTMNGTDAIATIRGEFPEARIVVLTAYKGDIQALRAFKAGAVGYLLKNMLRKELLDTIRIVASGRRRVPPEIARELGEHIIDEQLSEREIEVLKLIAAGTSNKIIAATLSSSVSKRSKIKEATMRNSSSIVALVAALLTFGTGASAQTQQQSQPVPDAPQPQKKPAPKAQPSDSAPPPADQPATKPAPAKDDNAFPEDQSSDAARKADESKPPAAKDNPFPEDVSKDAAKAASGDNSKQPAAKDNPFPDDVSKDAAKAASGDTSKQPAAKDNPFPEDISRDAAKAAGNDETPTPAGKTNLPPGVSSSQSPSSSADGDEIANPGQAKKDAEVGGFYLKQGNYQGALLRYQDATTADPTNVDAIFGRAEAERLLKKNAEAAKDYQLYLDIVPDGPRSKQALKALKTLPPG